MKKCSESCVPCCDFCRYVVHEMYDDVIGPPIKCMLHRDEEHRRLAEDCSYCDDFWCKRAWNYEIFRMELAYHYTPKARPKFIICDESKWRNR